MRPQGRIRPIDPRHRIHLIEIMQQPFSSNSHWPVWLFLSLVLLGFDQAIKYTVSIALPLHASLPVSSFFNLVHVLNPGAAFSFLAEAGGWQRHFFTAFGSVVSAYLLITLWRGLSSRLETLAHIALIGGALGNVLDRIRIGAVVDYLDFHWQGWHWPAFNLADVFVVTGATFLVLAGILAGRREATRALT